jgi:hypothetical protein
MHQEQQNPRDDPVPSIKSSSPILLNSVAGPLTKLPIKITSVVLDGMEMKLSSGMNAGIGFSRN